MSKYCINCRALLEDDAMFCDECGTQQTVAEGTNQEAVKDEKKKKETDKMKQSGFGIAALVFGIISAVSLGMFLVPEVLGVVFGIVGLTDKSKKRTFALAGLIASLISAVVFVILLVV